VATWSVCPAELWNTASTTAVMVDDPVFVMVALTEWYGPNSEYFGADGKVNVPEFPVPPPPEVTVTVAVTDEERPAKVLAETTRVQVPFARLFTDTT